MDRSMIKELQNIITEWRSKGVCISDEDAEYILGYCNRKMDVCKIKNRDEYLPLLYADEVKNYFFRKSVNAATMLRKMEEDICAVCV